MDQNQFFTTLLINYTNDINFRSSRPDVFCKKDVVKKNFAKFTGKHIFREHIWWLRIQFAIVGTSVIVNMSIIDFLCCMLLPR